MTGHRAVGVVLTALLASCTSPAAPVTTTTTTTAPAVDTVPDPTTTTTVAGEPVDMCPRGLIWETGTTYNADCFVVPIRVTPEDDGWRSYGAHLVAFRVEWKEPGGEIEVGVQGLAYEIESLPEDVIDRIASIDGVGLVSAISTTTVGEWSGKMVDVRTEPDPQSSVAGGEECSRAGFSLAWGFDAWPGYPLVVHNPGGGTHEYGLGACRMFRVWVLSVDRITVTLTAVVYDEDRFHELIPLAERLLATLELDGA